MKGELLHQKQIYPGRTHTADKNYKAINTTYQHKQQKKSIKDLVHHNNIINNKEYLCNYNLITIALYRI